MNGINARQLREQIIAPALKAINAYSPAAENLVFGTACAESACGHFLRQFPAGPALGIFQIERATHNDMWNNYIMKRPQLHAALRERVGIGPVESLQERLISDLLYSAMMCRVFYLRVPAALPAATDVQGMAEYWKKYYNTHLGKGTPQKFVDAFVRYNK